MNFLAPADLSKALVGVGEKKAAGTAGKLLLLGILAGVFIGFAAHLATVVATGWTIGGDPALFGLKKFFIGAVFSVGLMLVIIPGSELWTGNNLMTVALLNKKIGFAAMMRNWIIVYAGNLIGSILLAWIIAASSGLLDSNVGGTAINIAYGKVANDIPMGHNYGYFFRAIGCNWLVCLAVMMAIAAKDIAGKVLAIFFPIMAFVTSGFEHCIANMYFIPAGIFGMSMDKGILASAKGKELITEGLASGKLVIAENLTETQIIAAKAEYAKPLMGNVLNWSTMWSQNIAVVTLGNLVGGAILCGMVYWFLYVKGQKEA